MGQTSFTQARSDAELISAVRAGDVDAYGELFERHVDPARRLARSLTSDGEADDLVSEAFAKVLVVLQRGEGPDTALRPYLLTAVRRLHVDRARSLARTRPTDDIAAYDAGEEFHDTAVAGFESGAAARAFASLPERWQLVLWHLEVEGQKPAEVAPLLGMSANSVSALGYRAREGLRQAFVSMHAQVGDDERCARTRALLGAFIRDDISKRDGAAVESHLGECRECTGIYLELVEVNSHLRAVLAPIVLGGAAAAYLGGGAVGGAVGGAGAAGFLAGVGGFLGRNWVRTLAGAAAAGVVVAGTVVGIRGSDDPATDVAGERIAPVTRDKVTKPADKGGPQPSSNDPRPSDPPSADTSPAAEDAPAEQEPTTPPDRPNGPQDQPEPTDQPTDHPTDQPEPDDEEPVTSRTDVTSSASPVGGLVWDVAIRVTGLAPDERGTVTVTTDQPAAALHLDPRCDLVNVGTLTCRLTGPGTLQLLVTPVPGTPTTVTAVLQPGDRRSSVRLG